MDECNVANYDALKPVELSIQFVALRSLKSLINLSHLELGGRPLASCLGIWQ